MPNLPTDPDNSISRLLDDGYDVLLQSGHLVVNRVPYLTSAGLHTDGRLALPVDDSVRPISDATGNHTIWFAGNEPVDERGATLGTRSPREIGDGTQAQFMMSFKPPSGTYPDIYDKVTHYVRILQGAAQQIDPEVTAAVGAAFQYVEDDLPLAYRDTNTTRAGLTALNNLYRGHTIAIVGVGGTGSYILDQVAKTWVDRIWLFDGDTFQNHNAFRAPGAAAKDDLQGKRNKADYFAEQYSKMHLGITPHPIALTPGNLERLDGVTFAFLAAADSPERLAIMTRLRERQVPFIDVGMSFRQVGDRLTGLLKVMSYWPGSTHQLPPAPATLAQPDDYNSNIQVADLNCLNATLAVIQWKRYLGIYATHTPATDTVYKLFTNDVRNGGPE